MPIYRISGFNNGCAMYSLVLGTALLIQQSNEPGNAPNFVRDITPDSVSPDNNIGNDEIRVIEKKMRQELAQAIREDKAFKSATMNNFLLLLTTDDTKTQSDTSLQSLRVSNLHNIEEMRKKIAKASQGLNQKSIISASLTQTATESETKTETETETEQQVAPAEKLQQLFKFIDELQHRQTDTMIEQFNEFINKYKTIKEKLNNDKSLTPTEKNTLKNSVTHWFLNKATDLLPKDNEPKLQSVLLNLAACYQHCGGTNDIAHNAKVIYAKKILSTHWEQVYDNYVQYIQTSDCMITLEEINCLATQWGIWLKYRIGHGGEYNNFSPESSASNNHPIVHLTFINNNHWEIEGPEWIASSHSLFNSSYFSKYHIPEKNILFFFRSLLICNRALATPTNNQKYLHPMQDEESRKKHIEKIKHMEKIGKEALSCQKALALMKNKYSNAIDSNAIDSNAIDSLRNCLNVVQFIFHNLEIKLNESSNLQPDQLKGIFDIIKIIRNKAEEFNKVDTEKNRDDNFTKLLNDQFQPAGILRIVKIKDDYNKSVQYKSNFFKSLLILLKNEYLSILRAHSSAFKDDKYYADLCTFSADIPLKHMHNNHFPNLPQPTDTNEGEKIERPTKIESHRINKLFETQIKQALHLISQCLEIYNTLHSKVEPQEKYNFLRIISSAIISLNKKSRDMESYFSASKTDSQIYHLLHLLIVHAERLQAIFPNHTNVPKAILVLLTIQQSAYYYLLLYKTSEEHPPCLNVRYHIEQNPHENLGAYTSDTLENHMASDNQYLKEKLEGRQPISPSNDYTGQRPQAPNFLSKLIRFLHRTHLYEFCRPQFYTKEAQHINDMELEISHPLADLASTLGDYNYTDERKNNENDKITTFINNHIKDMYPDTKDGSTGDMSPTYHL